MMSVIKYAVNFYWQNHKTGPFMKKKATNKPTEQQNPQNNRNQTSSSLTPNPLNKQKI